MKPDANTTFFGNSVDTGMMLDELIVFLEEVETFVSKKHTALQSGEFQELESSELEHLKYHFEHTQGYIVRHSIIVSLVSTLEYATAKYCNTFKKYMDLKFSHKDFVGSALEQFKIYISKVLCLPFDFQGDLWEDVKGLCELRNYLVHSVPLANFGKKPILEKFIQSTPFELIDDQVDLNKEGCLYCINIVNDFDREITRLALQVFPGHFGSNR